MSSSVPSIITTSTISLIIFYVFAFPILIRTLAAKASNPLAIRLVAGLFYFGTSFAVAQILQSHLQTPAERFHYATLFAVYAHQGIKLLHALVVGPRIFVQDYRLTTAWRTFWFGFVPPTLLFDFEGNADSREKKNDDKSNNDEEIQLWKARNVNKISPTMLLTRGLIQLVAMITLAVFLWKNTWIERFHALDAIGTFYLLALSYGMFDICFNAPAAYAMNGNIVCCVQTPILSCSPTDFWRKWSKSAGLHLRRAFFDPQIPNFWLGAMMTFGANAVLHACWIGPMTSGAGPGVEWRYGFLLWIGPLPLMALERWQGSRRRRWISLLLLYVGITTHIPVLQKAVDFPTTSWALAARILRQES